ncbi:nucleolar protein 4-like [Anneissia japonica]|uniref:nucleolar protein 4-like n=1 Tax=Anneissia japonica TaxID=1529436 RepID=UPI00142572FD|nr:nucleolar protein 4-like [Anneissia japonica]
MSAMDPVLTKDEIKRTYQTWAELNYGEGAKTKTVTQKKYNRIAAFLRGDEPATTENAKFRFWLKAKGFKLGPEKDKEGNSEGSFDDVIYVPVKSPESSGMIVDRGYKRVAVVEDFFDIIYAVHVESDCKGGKHAGQKRTYKAIAETYAFLPREAVSRFLMNCSDCLKRMHLSPNNTNEPSLTNSGPVASEDTAIDYNMPITTTYLTKINRLRYDIVGEVGIVRTGCW